MKNIAQAILKVMQEVKGVEKNMTVGAGNNSYKGVSDYDVKKIIGESMRKNGLCLIPTTIKPTVRIDRWEEDSNYGKKQKQSVFTEVETNYLLLHESGEHIELSGYGHGVDTQDKGAGKATTYALKYALLYTFLTPTGAIDDADKEHSEEKEVPKTSSYNHNAEKGGKPLVSNAAFKKLLDRMNAGELGVYEKAIESCSFDEEQRRMLDQANKNKN